MGIFLLSMGQLFGANTSFDTGVAIYGGFAPTFGGNLTTTFQQDTLNLPNGILSINRTKTGETSAPIAPLLGGTAGIEFWGITRDFIIISCGANFTYGIMGGSGNSLDNSENTMSVKYSLWTVDIPLTVGITIPFWDDIRISFKSGIAIAYGKYSNVFKSSIINSSSNFTGYGAPVVTSLAGDYLFYHNFSLYMSITHYSGSTKIIKDEADYASINFSGYRIYVGTSFRFKSSSSTTGGKR